MAEYSDPDEKTEDPTAKRMEQLRKDGTIHVSTDLSSVASLAMSFFVLQLIWSSFFNNFKEEMVFTFTMINSHEPMTEESVYSWFGMFITSLGPLLFLLFLTVAVVGILATMLQTGWNIKEKVFTPKFEQLNPINGIQRMFSMQSLMNLFKSVAKIALILPISYFAIKAIMAQMVMLVHLTIPEVMSFTGSMMATLFWKIVFVLIILAILDWVWGKYQWLRKNRMTKDEVKDERRSLEGDEATKRKIQFKGMQRIMQRIVKSVPQADVVITNPTHYSVALKYDRETMDAPIVVAKGQGFIALRIREIAKEHNIPVLERKPLARALYASVEVGGMIPFELFKAVAEVLAYVYKLKNPYKYQQASKE